MKTKPQFEHDCPRCAFLGRLEVSPGENDMNPTGEATVKYDLYFCVAATPTVIGRYGDEGYEYCSGMSFADRGSQPLAEAKSRAIKQGLYDPTPQPLRWPREEEEMAVVAMDKLKSALDAISELGGPDPSSSGMELFRHKVKEDINADWFFGGDEMRDAILAYTKACEVRSYGDPSQS